MEEIYTEENKLVNFPAAVYYEAKEKTTSGQQTKASPGVFEIRPKSHCSAAAAGGSSLPF
jgi:hypothetical protein